VFLVLLFVRVKTGPGGGAAGARPGKAQSGGALRAASPPKSH